MRSVAGSFKAAAVAYLVACDASAVAMLHRDSSLRSARIATSAYGAALNRTPGQHGARQHSAALSPRSHSALAAPQLVILR